MAHTTTTLPASGPPTFDAERLYSAHPILDPDLLDNDRSAQKYFERLLRDHLRNDWHYSRLLNRLLHPLDEEHSIEVNERILASYLADASSYLHDLIELLPESERARFAPEPGVDGCNALRRLAELFFDSSGSPEEAYRRRFEVQRKLYLTKLLLHIDNTRMVQDGPRHKAYLLEVLDQQLWAYVKETRTSQAHYRSPGAGEAASPEAWNFQVKRVARKMPGSLYDIEVFHFDTRFKKETAGFDYAPGRGAYEVAERIRFGRMKRNRSGSILSKLLRKAINDPNAITDILGMKFIVGERRDVHRLADLLHQVLGGPFLYRNQVDLFLRPEDHGRLNRFSAPDFCAFKEDLDILFPSRESKRNESYYFAVELQILTVDSFLRTLHSRDYVSHAEYKRRQFLQGVIPCVFPDAIYGSLLLERD